MGGSYYDEEYRDTHSEYELNRAAGFRSREWLPRGCDFDDAARRPEPALHARAGRRSSAVVVREVDHSSEGGVVGRALEGSPYPAKADPARLPAAGRRVVVVRRSKEEEDRSLSPRRPRGGLVVEDDFEARDAERVSRAVSRKNQRTGARVIRLGRDRRGDLVVLQDDQGGDEDVVVVRRGNGRRVVLQDDDGRAYDDYEDYEDDPADESQSPYLDRLQRVSKKPDLVPVPSSNGDMVDTHLKSKSEVDGLRFKYEGTEFRESTVGKVKGGSRRGRRRGAANRDYDRILAAELANAVYRARDSAETPAGRRRDDDWPWTAL
ncbi:hypothetical protein JL720_16101 [Aureococcus anophagefferens]|nr:hypothetical protein JL720_16101 [Aureococcus anophagefferens]